MRILIRETGGGRWIETVGRGKSTVFRETSGVNRRGEPNLTGTLIEMNPRGTHHPDLYPYWKVSRSGQASERVPAAGHRSFDARNGGE